MVWTKWMLCAAAVMGAGALHAQAQEGTDVEEEMTQFFANFDQNKDGKVTIAELKKVVAASLETTEDAATVAITLSETLCLFVAADANDDGGVDKKEYRALRDKQLKDPAYKPPLSKADIETLRKEQYGPVLKMVVDAADSDGDGKLSRVEYEEAVGDTTDFDKADTNKDGLIDKAEMDADWLKELGKRFELPKEGDEKTGEKAGEKAGEKTGETTPEKPEETAPEKTPEKPVEPKPPVEKINSVFNKPGRVWLLKQTTKFGSVETTSYQRTEVKSCDDVEATVQFQSLDKDKKPLAGGEAEESRVKLKPDAASGDKPTDLGKETINTLAGEFECTVSETRVGDTTTRTWVSIKYPGLVVKLTVKSTSLETTSLLVEFKD
ncbi:MAG: EF-hand domain-containing protein [Planctomycetes bacterium]|nr:EF-hand domain-containing protein [Planctomycetota bacterium]